MVKINTVNIELEVQFFLWAIKKNMQGNIAEG